MDDKSHSTIPQPSTPQAPTPPVSPLPQNIYPSPRHYPKKAIIAITFLFIFVIIFGTTWAFKDQISQSNQTPPTITATPTQTTPTPPTDTTADWKTYHNDKYNYTISLPQNFVLHEVNKIADTATEYTILRSSIYQEDSTECLGGCSLPITQGWEMEIRIQREWDRGFDREFFLSSSHSKIISNEDTTINNMSALVTERKRPDLPDTGNTDLVADVVVNDMLYSLRFSTELKMKLNNKQLFKKILSTFKFTKMDDQPFDTYNWKSYSKDEYGYSLKYPPDASVEVIPEKFDDSGDYMLSAERLEISHKTYGTVHVLDIPLDWRNKRVETISVDGKPGNIHFIDTGDQTLNQTVIVFVPQVLKEVSNFGMRMQIPESNNEMHLKYLKTVLSTVEFNE